HQPAPQRFVIPPALVSEGPHRRQQQTAGPPLAEGMLALQLLDSCLLGYELRLFFRITDCSASLSRLRSATSFRSFVFSSRSCFASCAWLTSIPPYLVFHWYRVGAVAPTSRATCAAGRPA